MIAEYKRDMNHSYLILTGEREADTAAYPVRMLLGNTVPALLKCHLQGLDGKSLFYYEITSRQSLSSFYENRFLGVEDLRFILGCLIQTMEKLEEYLLDPIQLVLDPDYTYLDLEKKELRYCYFPGYAKPIDEQFRMLVEYLLPKLDHGDSQAVSLGYGIYRKALEEQFQLENIRKELYKERTEEDQTNAEREQESLLKADKPESTHSLPPAQKPERMEEDLWERDILREGFPLQEESPKAEKEKKKKIPEKDRKSSHGAGEQKKRKTQMLVTLSGCALAVATILVILMAAQFGYIPQVHVEKILVGVVAVFGVGIAAYLIVPSLIPKAKKEDTLDEKIRIAVLHRETAEQNIEKESISHINTSLIEDQTVTASGEPKIRKGNAWKEEAGDYHETVILSLGKTKGPASLVSREPGELATIYLNDELTVIGKMKTAADAVIPLPTVSRLHAKIRKKDDEFYLTDLNSRNGTAVNGRMLHSEEEYQLQDEDEVDFAQARYIFLK